MLWHQNIEIILSQLKQKLFITFSCRNILKHTFYNYNRYFSRSETHSIHMFQWFIEYLYIYRSSMMQFKRSTKFDGHISIIIIRIIFSKYIKTKLQTESCCNLIFIGALRHKVSKLKDINNASTMNVWIYNAQKSSLFISFSNTRGKDIKICN